jgi:hypothetical protein
MGRPSWTRIAPIAKSDASEITSKANGFEKSGNAKQGAEASLCFRVSKAFWHFTSHATGVILPFRFVIPPFTRSVSGAVMVE